MQLRTSPAAAHGYADAEWQARDLQVTGLETSFEAWRGDRRLGPVRLNMPGRHHALNALAALAVADDLEIPFRIAAHGPSPMLLAVPSQVRRARALPACPAPIYDWRQFLAAHRS